MSIPGFSAFLEPLLRYLGESEDAVTVRGAADEVAERAGLTEEERRVTIQGRRLFVHRIRIGWAQDRLRHAGLARSPSPGFWEATERGRQFLNDHPEPFSADLVASMSRIRHAGEAPFAWKVLPPTAGDEEVRGEMSDYCPEERIEAALEDLEGALGEELLELVQESTPQFFEELVLDLLRVMDYGFDEAELRSPRRPGDLDGVISLDPLGVDRVYLHARRLGGTIDRPEIQDFHVALTDHDLDDGILITSALLTHEADRFRRSLRDNIVVIDGDGLVELMIRYGVGVEEKEIIVPSLDRDYFESD